MEENWDWDDGSSNTFPVGRIFGSRGRGFNFSNMKEELPVVGKSPMREVINWPTNNSDNSNNKKENSEGEDAVEKKNDKKKSWSDFANKKIGKSTRNRIAKGKKATKSSYIPNEPTEDENEIFGNTISCGINFNKYEDFKVKVTGENPPNAISSFNECGLSNYMADLIRKCNYKTPTPIQKFCIPIIMAGRDVMACAQTGSGKTAAFLIPIVHKLLEEKNDLNSKGYCKPQAVIVSPTRELCIQIFNEARKFSCGSNLKIGIVYGGTSLPHQLNEMKKGCHILVATVGRLVDFLNRNVVNMSDVRFLVLDEADLMLDKGFLSDVEEIMTCKTMPEKNTIMLSATFREDIQRLASKFLKNYLFVAVGIVGGACTDVEQKIYLVKKFEKRNKIVELLQENGSSKTLVFVQKKRMSDFVGTYLCEKNFPATTIHGDRKQPEREEALDDFKSGKMDVLVATSVAAWGLNIKNVAHVINYDLPSTIDEYVHRIGRTGRVGNRGLATSFYDPDVDKSLAPDLVKILTQAGQPVPEFLQKESKNLEECANFVGNHLDIKENESNSVLHTQQIFDDEEWI